MPIPRENSNPYNRKSAKEVVLETVQEWIVTGVMKPGEKIVDTELAKYFSVSRTPVREAIQTLANLGFVEVVPSCGTQVAGIDPEDVRQCYELIAELQSVALGLAAPKIGEAQLAVLKDINERFRKAVKEHQHDILQELDHEFHEFIILLSCNRYLQSYNDQLKIRTLRVENLFFGAEEGQQISVEQHAQIIAGLKNGDLAAAQAAMRANWLSTYDRLEGLLK